MVFMGLFLWRSIRGRTSWEPALGKGDHEGDHCTPVLHTILTGLGSTWQATLLKPGPRKAGPEPGDRMSYLTQLHSLFSGVSLVVFCPGRRQTLSDGTATNCHVHRVLWAGLIHIWKQMPHHCGMRSAQAVSTVWVLTRSECRATSIAAVLNLGTAYQTFTFQFITAEKSQS